MGPTASGKTPVSLFLAQQLDGEIISADSRQVYKYMDIGTAKPSVEQRKLIKHYFVDERKPDEEFNAGEFGKRGREIIEDIFDRRKQPILVGGSGLYVRALVDGFFDTPPKDVDLRTQLFERLHNEGRLSLLNELRKVDPTSAAQMLPSNTRRIVRALEVYRLTGIPISQHRQHQRIERTFEPVFTGLTWERKKLYEQIEARVDRMMEMGLIGEVESLRDKGYDSSLNALQTVGYQEVFQYLKGKVSKERMIELIKQNSRRYAKRQLTWFRHDKRITWFPVSNARFDDVAQKVLMYFQRD